MKMVHLLGIVFLLVGASLLFGPTAGVSTISADRGTFVSTAPDDSALIALNPTDYDDLDHQSYETIAMLENNVKGPMAVDYVLTADHDGVSLRFDGQTGASIDAEIEMGSSDSEEIELQCDSPGQMDGPVTVTAEIIEATGSGLTITDVEMHRTVSCDGDLPESGETEFESLEVTVNERNNGRVDSTRIEWEIENPADVDYILVDTSYSDPVEIEPTDSPYTINDFQGNRKFDFDVTVDIDGGERCEFTFSEGGTRTLEDCR